MRALTYRLTKEIEKKLDDAKWELKLSKQAIITKALMEFLGENKA